MICPKYAYIFRTSLSDLPGYDPLIAVTMNFRGGREVSCRAILRKDERGSSLSPSF